MISPLEPPGGPEISPGPTFATMRRVIFRAFFFACYAGFILLNVLSPETMRRDAIPLGGMELMLGGLNLAVAGGMVFIFGVVLLAVS